MQNQRKNPRPPAPALWLLKQMFRDDFGRYTQIGDIEEAFNRIAEEKGATAANAWYWMITVQSVPYFIKNTLCWSVIMFMNYMKLTFRNIRRHKVYSLINIGGLAVGLACCFLIISYILYELSYDKYHTYSDRIYRIGMEAEISGSHLKAPRSGAPVAPALVADFPEVENAVRINLLERKPFRYDEKEFNEDRVYFGDNSIFDVFSFELLLGDKADALSAPFSIVLTERLARKYFGEENPVGKIISVGNDDQYTVTGVMRNVPRNSHFIFDGLCSFETLTVINPDRMSAWLPIDYCTYILLQENADYLALEAKFPAFINKYMGSLLEALGGRMEFFLQPLTDIHLHSHLEVELEGNSDIAYVYIFSAVAFLILLIACINFMNLATARAATRSREVGVRKALGAERSRLVNQFLGESIIYGLISVCLAFLIVITALPYISSVSGIDLQLDYGRNPWLPVTFVLFGLAAGAAAGIYPAFYLSSFEPAGSLKRTILTGRSKSGFRSVFVVTQFVISIALIIGTFIISGQLDYLKEKRLGFNKEQVVVLPLTDDTLFDSLPSLKKELMNYDNITGVSASSTVPGGFLAGELVVPEGFSDDQSQIIRSIAIDHDFIPVMEIEIIEGRNFSPDFSGDPENSVLINQTAAERFGWEDPVGKTIQLYRSEKLDVIHPQTVIGVVKDFHVESLYKKIEPLYIQYRPGYFKNLSIRTKATNISATLAFIQSKIEDFAPGNLFDYFFLDASFDSQYRTEEKLNRIFSGFTSIAILIACIGLFGMASFITEMRTKEIGVRKVLGASTSEILLLLLKEFFKWVLIANVIAWPLAWYGMNKWLQNFAYHTEINPAIFVLSGLLSMAVAFLTVSYQTTRAARANPVDSLRYE